MNLDRARLLAALSILLATTAAAVEWRNLSPSPRTLPTIIVDTAGHRAILFGGAAADEYYNDVWELPLDTVAGYRWLPVVTSGSPPSGRWGHRAAYDADAGRMYVFAGKAGEYPVNDVWALDLETMTWQQLSPSGTPPAARISSMMAYCPSRHSLVVYGGTDAAPMGDVWELKLDSMRWRALSPSGSAPAERWGGGQFMDLVNNRLVIVGGIGDVFYNDVWALDLTSQNGTWQELSVTGTPPAVRGDYAYAYDELQGRYFVFGGWNYPPHTLLDDAFVLEMADLSWHELTASGEQPRERRCPVGFYDPDNQNFVVFGGQGYMTFFCDLPYVHFPAGGVGEWKSPQPGSVLLLQVATVTSEHARIRYCAGDAKRVGLRIIDATGRVVRHLSTGIPGSSSGWVTWDRTDDLGGAVSPGDYYCYLETERGGVSRKLVLVE